MPRVIVPVTELTPPKATLTTALAGTNNDLKFTAKTGGPAGNSIRIAYIVAAGTVPLTIVVEGFDITVNVATTAGAPTSTAAQVESALESNGDAARLITVENAPSNDGTGVVAALSMTALAGGALQTTPPTQVDGDATNGHLLTGNDGLVTLEVVSSDASSRTVSIGYGPHYAPVAAVAAQVETIPAGVTRILGPFAPNAFDQNAAHDLYFTPSVATTLKFRAYRTVRAT